MRRLFPGVDLVTGRTVRALKQFRKTQEGKKQTVSKEQKRVLFSQADEMEFDGSGIHLLSRETVGFVETRDQGFLPKVLQA